MTRTRMTPADRKASILAAAVSAAQQYGFAQLRLHHIAAADECSNATVVAYFGTMTKMRRAVMRAAIQRELLPIIAAGVAMGDATAIKAPQELQRKALSSLA